MSCPDSVRCTGTNTGLSRVLDPPYLIMRETNLYNTRLVRRLCSSLPEQVVQCFTALQKVHNVHVTTDHFHVLSQFSDHTDTNAIILEDK